MQFCVANVEVLTIARRLTKCSAQACRTVTRNTNEAGLLVECTTNCLTNPERCVGGELKSTAPVELVDSVLEAEVSFLNEVEKVHALWQWVTASNRYNESQVGANEVVFRYSSGLHVFAYSGGLFASFVQGSSFAAFFNGFREGAFIFGSEEGYFADVIQIETNCVVHVLFRFR